MNTFCKTCNLPKQNGAAHSCFQSLMEIVNKKMLRLERRVSDCESKVENGVQNGGELFTKKNKTDEESFMM